jgi:hypothetical protein
MVARILIRRAVYALTVHHVSELKQALIDLANRTSNKLSVSPNPDQHECPILSSNPKGYSCCSVSHRRQ